MNRQHFHVPIMTSIRGTTLSEILVSLLVMSIGVVSLATLFPISVLRVVQATQLTNAANLRYNVEAALGPHPELYTVAGNWRASYSYSLNDLAIPSPLTSLKSPAVVFQATTVTGDSGALEPQWKFDGSTTIDGGITWSPIFLKNYVVDPLGAVLVEGSYRTSGSQQFFGNTGISSPFTGVPSVSPGVGAFAGVTPINEGIADDLASLPDSWISQADSIQLTYSRTTTPFECTLGGLQSLFDTPLPLSGFPQSRVVFFDSTGKISFARPILSYGNTLPQSVSWPASSGALPPGFMPARARIESKERRYTWLLSVRRTFSGAANMDVVVFFRRPFSGKDEQVYPATFTSVMDFGSDAAPGVGGSGIGSDDDGNGITNFLSTGAPDPGEIGWPGSDDTKRNWVLLHYDGNGERPFVKKGGFVTDVDNLRWYRIVDVVEGDATGGYQPAYVLPKVLNMGSLNPSPSISPTYTIETGAFGASTRTIFLRVEGAISESGPRPNAGNTPNGRAMVMRGIVDVFPIRAHLTWEN